MKRLHTHTTTADEFLTLPERNSVIELIEGAIIVPPSPEFEHQFAHREVFRILLTVENGELISAPMDVRLDEQTVVQPDVLWLAPDTRCVVDRIVYGAPDLVVEILSPATAKRDWQDKYRLYEQHGTREYWIVDPMGRTLELFVRQADRFQHGGTFGPAESFQSALLGIVVELTRLFPPKK